MLLRNGMKQQGTTREPGSQGAREPGGKRKLSAMTCVSEQAGQGYNYESGGLRRNGTWDAPFVICAT